MKRIIDTAFWTDDKIVELFSPEDKLFFLYLMTNPHSTQLGIYHINKKIMAFELGYSMETVAVLLDRFESKYDLIKYSEETSEVAIKNYLKHSIVKGGFPVECLLKKEIENVKNKALLGYVYGNLSNADNLNQTVKEILIYINNILINNNVNENAVSYHDSYNDSCHDSSKPKKKKADKFEPPTVQDIKAYCIEKGYDIDAEAFWGFYESKGWMVGKNKMKSWRGAIVSWNSRDKEKKQNTGDRWLKLYSEVTNE